jgi:hypothetical protein
MSGTAATQLGNGMTHQPVWSTHMTELAAVVTARLHDHPGWGVTRYATGTRHPGCRPLARSSTQAWLTRAHPPPPRTPTGRAREARPTGGTRTMIPIAGHHHGGVEAEPSGRSAAGLDPGST